ncbi:hypothetical protein DHEL01_v201031 [Diaporthe helianthi]|uniref:Uncharacterized protein n=1 Tax=Diaporthe helianthi TaxID=158607 RepID=A0A2P5IDL0_DIAHE|nr:hypothetical protein DHEL01_v201031 [Diaporthe helianthi]
MGGPGDTDENRNLSICLPHAVFLHPEAAVSNGVPRSLSFHCGFFYCPGLKAQSVVEEWRSETTGSSGQTQLLARSPLVSAPCQCFSRPSQRGPSAALRRAGVRTDGRRRTAKAVFRAVASGGDMMG